MTTPIVPKEKKPWQSFIMILLAIGSIVTLGLGIYEVARANDLIEASGKPQSPNVELIKGMYGQATTCFSLAFGALILAGVLPRLATLNFGTSGLTLTLNELQKDVAIIRKQSEYMQQALQAQVKDNVVLRPGNH